MKWSWRIARIAGIDVFVHATFFILIVWIAMSYLLVGGNISAAISGIIFILVLFGCVILHEFGHALAAKRYGIVTTRITLLPIGGVASMERMPDDPKQEIAVALAGPAVNFVIAALIWLWLTLNGSAISAESSTEGLSLINGSFLQRLMLVNIILGVFNLVPAFPMDGGRVLRAVLAMHMDHNKATQLAARVGQGLALWFGLFGLLYNPFLIFIALFVWIGAAAEAGMEDVKYTLTDMEAGKAMLTDFQVLSPHDPLSRAIELTLAGSQMEFPVMESGTMIGVLEQANLLKGLEEGGRDAQVSKFMQSGVQNADIHEPLDAVLKRLQLCDCRLIPVLENGDIVGIININNILELISIQKALHEEGRKKLKDTEWKA